MVWRAIRTHWFGTVVATLGSLVFFGASLYVDAIRSAFPFYWGPYTTWVWPAAWFWLGVLMVTIMLGVKNKSDEDARQNLVDATERVRTLVQTLPPRGWREEYAGSVDIAATAMNQLMPRKPSEGLGKPQLAVLIARLLESIATLAYQYDGRPRIGSGPALYAANVMIFVPRAEREPYFSADVSAALRFVPDDYDQKQLAGVLRLFAELTYSTKDAGVDAHIPAIALPVPSSITGSDKRWRVLPGAPLAFAGADGIDGYADVATLPTWFDTRADFPPSVRDGVAGYFNGEGSASRSFVSHRISASSGPIGVLNLHSDRANLLGVIEGTADPEASAARREEFFAFMTPFLRELENAVELYRTS